MKHYLLILTVFFAGILSAQNVAFKKKNFNSEADYQKAIEHLSNGDEYFFEGKFEKALPDYDAAQKFNPNNAILNFKIGACYLKLEEFAKAKPYFLKAKELKANVDPKIDFAIAQSYEGNEEYPEAIVAYKAYLKDLPKSSKHEETSVKERISYCNAQVISGLEAKGAANTELASKEAAPMQKTKIDVAPRQTVSSEVAGQVITYKIQISSSSNPANMKNLRGVYSGRLKISFDKYKGLYKYYIGEFYSKEKALEALSMSGVSDAFIVKFINGKR